MIRYLGSLDLESCLLSGRAGDFILAGDLALAGDCVLDTVLLSDTGVDGGCVFVVVCTSSLGWLVFAGGFLILERVTLCLGSATAGIGADTAGSTTGRGGGGITCISSSSLLADFFG